MPLISYGVGGIFVGLLSLKVRTPASQAGDDGFKSHRSYCGQRIKAVQQTVELSLGDFPRPPLWTGMPSGEGSGL